MPKIATTPSFSGVVAILFFLNCQRQDYIDFAGFCNKKMEFPLQTNMGEYGTNMELVANMELNMEI